MASSTACPDADALRRLSQGQLPGGTADEIRQHLKTCIWCRQKMRGLADAETEGNGPVAAFPQDATAGFAGKDPHEIYAALQQTTTFPFLSPPQGPGEIGRLSHYRVVKMLGEGGMGIVFQAEDLHLHRPVALKVMKPHLAAKPIQKERFMREARATAALKNDHIVTIYHVNEEKGIPFFAMEFLQGMPLDQYLAKGRKPSVLQILRLARQMALGLAAAHEIGLIHRDIKPGNLWIEATGGGRVKILDFGLARREDNVNITRAGAIVGTPAYMSPEQARGLKLDPRSDLFSLGSVLYRLVTGAVPFQGDSTMAVLTSLAIDKPRPVRELNPEIPAPLAELIQQLLSKRPQDRPASAKVVAQSLTAMEKEATAAGAVAGPIASGLATVPLGTAALPPPPPAPPVKKRRWVRWVVIGVVVLVTLGIINSFINPRGTLDVKVDDTVELTIKMGEQVLFERSKEREFEIPVGTGKVEVYEPDGGARLLEDDFKVVRNGRSYLDLTAKLKKARDDRDAAPPPDKTKKKKDKVSKDKPSTDKTSKDRPLKDKIPKDKSKGGSVLDTFQQREIPRDLSLLAVGGVPGKKPPPELVAAFRVPANGLGKKAEANNVLFTPEGDWMMTSGSKTPFILWKLDKTAIPLSLTKDLEVSNAWLSNDGTRLFLGFPKVMHVFSFKDKMFLQEIRPPGAGVALWEVSPDGRFVVAGHPGGTFSLYNALSGKEVQKFFVSPTLRSFAFHPRQPWLLTHFWHEDLQVFLSFVDMESDKNWEGPTKRTFKMTSAPGWTTPTFTPDGKMLLFGTLRDNRLYRLDVHKNEPLPALEPIAGHSTFAVSPRGDLLAIHGPGKNLEFWDLHTAKRLHGFELPYVPPGIAAQPFFAPDGRHVAIPYQDVVYLYRLDSLAE